MFSSPCLVPHSWVDDIIDDVIAGIKDFIIVHQHFTQVRQSGDRDECADLLAVTKCGAEKQRGLTCGMISAGLTGSIGGAA